MAWLFPRLRYGDAREALAVRDTSWTYADLRAAAGAHMLALDAAGCGPGARVGVVTHGTLSTMAALVGNALAGVTSVPLNPKLGVKERAHILSDAAPRVVFADADAGDLGDARAVAGLPTDAKAAKDASARVDRAAPTDWEAPAFILYTSGTTGAPKGAVITNGNVRHNLDALATVWGWRDAHTVVHALPLFHVHGLILGLFGVLRVGGALHHVPRFSPEALAEALRLRPGAMLFAVPTMYHRLAEAAEAAPALAEGLRHARLLVSGSAGLSQREHARIERLAGRGVHERYGLTETLINCAVPASDAPRPGYVGFPLPGVELRLVDDARSALPPERERDDTTIGEVAVRGGAVFQGYLGRPDATAAVRDDEGWFYTGDLATRAADGAVRLVGRRATDLIKTGGYKVGAGEVEAALLEHPSVRDVAVLGVPDDDLGERIEAFVVPRDGTNPDASALIASVCDALTPHKRPRAVHFIDALPRNAMGKVQKKRLLR